ncbi:TetR/AcrR family transcriptional regulator [Kordiimonas aquimaris]|uniref:TetR/AcrR family transcriptional regulator n=1 Tax=Kordiimonas aquimaris TaxID=707591 RepID=UPI0021D1BB1B|nr:TetR/AcrR family transcriptional regulator [Kordiimonas aquimaris]
MTDTRTKILKAASALFLEGGSAALSVRAIAARAEMSTIGIYSHFKGKQGILDALYTQAAEMASAAMDVQQAGLSPRDIMMTAARNYIVLSETNEAHYRLFFGESDPGYTPSPEAQKAGFEAFGKLLEQTAFVLPQDTAPEEVRDTALTIWALMHGFFGLRNHAGADKLRVESWRGLTLDAMSNHIDALLARKD